MPFTILPGDFAIEGIDANSGEVIELGDAQLVPEPSSWLLSGSGLLVLVVSIRRKRQSPERYFTGE